MTPAEFSALPVALQIRCMLEAFPAIEKALLKLEAPAEPFPPKYDERIRRKGGFQWASETAIASLHFYHRRATREGDSAFAERNLREAIALMRWIQWREWHPNETWSGERNRRACTAKPPSSKPELHTWEVRNAAGVTPARPTTSTVNPRALDGDEPEDFEDEELASGI